MALVQHRRPGTSARRRVMVIYGTRPEAVKVAPLIRALDESTAFTPLVAVTAQQALVDGRVGIQPPIPVAFADGERHPVVDLGQRTCRVRGDDGVGF